MDLGKKQILEVARIKDFGAYLTEVGEGEKTESVLLPKKQLPEDVTVGMKMEVFLYKDSADRLIATTKEPLLEVGQVKKLKVNDVAKMGAFVDIGLEKDVLLPFKQMEGQVAKGDEVLCALYVDRTQRLAATMRVYPYLKANTQYKKDEEVRGTVYEIQNMSVFVAVDDTYFGLIPKNESFEQYHIGETVHARILRVREDGKLDLSPRKKAYLQLNQDAEVLYERMQKNGGNLGATDHSSPEFIKKKFGLSKNAFKRAIGHLLKEGKIVLLEEDIVLKK